MEISKAYDDCARRQRQYRNRFNRGQNSAWRLTKTMLRMKETEKIQRQNRQLTKTRRETQ